MRCGSLLRISVAVGLVACSGDGALDQAGDAPAQPPREEPALVDAGDAPGPVADASTDVRADATTLANPVYTRSAADPFVLRVGNTWHAYATSGSGKHIPHLTSTDLQSWKLAGDALPTINASWIDADAPMTWAPSVAMIDATHYVLYYAPHVKGTPGRHCLGRATASDPAGPFVDDFGGPLHCDDTPGHAYWSIDPSPFQDDDGARYLLWRQDDGTNGSSHVAVRKLGPQGDQFAAGSTVKLILDHTPGSWEDNTSLGKLIENPAMIRAGAGSYLLFYSGNSWQTASYATGYAVCTSPTGPCVKKTTSAPWLASDGSMKGPGGLDFFHGPGNETWMAWHAWFGAVGPGQGTRQLFLGKLDVGADGLPKVGAPIIAP